MYTRQGKRVVRSEIQDHTAAVDRLFELVKLALQGWRKGKSARRPPMWPGFDSQIRRHMWVEFVASLLCTERFSLGSPVSPLLKNLDLT